MHPQSPVQSSLSNSLSLINSVSTIQQLRKRKVFYCSELLTGNALTNSPTFRASQMVRCNTFYGSENRLICTAGEELTEKVEHKIVHAAEGVVIHLSNPLYVPRICVQYHTICHDHSAIVWLERQWKRHDVCQHTIYHDRIHVQL